MALTGATVTEETTGLYSAQDSTDEATIKAATKANPKYTCVIPHIAADEAAVNTLYPIGVAELPMVVTSAVFYPGFTSAANSTNYTTLQLQQSTQAGSFTNLGAAISTASTALTKAIPRSLSLTAASCIVPAGNILMFAVDAATNGTGVATGAGILVVNGIYT